MAQKVMHTTTIRSTIQDNIGKGWSNNHEAVAISPDDFWLTISNGFSRHVLLNAEKFRDYFVSHEGKQTITVIYHEGPKMWPNVLNSFQSALQQRVKGEIAETLLCNFSTSGEVEVMASQVSVMCAMKSYFTYRCIPLCGIRDVYMLGTLEDWILLREKVEALQVYELDWWIPKVLDILNNLIETYKGNVNLDFWNSLVDIQRQRAGSGSVSCLHSVISFPLLLSSFFLTPIIIIGI